MKKILFILVILMTTLSFAKPKDWVDENKVKKAGYEIFSGVPKYNIYPIVFKKVLDNKDILHIRILDHTQYPNYCFLDAFVEEETKMKEIIGKRGKDKKILENKDLMIVEYYDKDSIKNNDPHPYIYVFYYYYTLDNDFIFAEYFSKEKLSKDTLDKMSGQIFDRLESFKKNN